jgi:hypothetical protein
LKKCRSFKVLNVLNHFFASKWLILREIAVLRFGFCKINQELWSQSVGKNFLAKLSA